MAALPRVTNSSGHPSERPAAALTDFANLLAQREDLREAVLNAASPEVIVQLAAAEGLHFSPLELRLASRHLAASTWPWAGRGRAARLEFFGEVL